MRHLMSVFVLSLFACNEVPNQTPWPAKESEVAADEPHVGQLTIEKGIAGNSGRANLVFGHAVGADCTRSQLTETCYIEQCPFNNPSSRSARAETGDLTVRAGGVEQVTLNSPWHPWTGLGQNKGFAPGDRVEVRGEGGLDVPEFALSLDAPIHVPSGILPPDYETPVRLSRDRAWVASWQATPPSDPTVLRFDLSSYEPKSAVTCEARASSGAIVIPPAVLARLGSGGGWIEITPRSRATTKAGMYEMSVVLLGSPCSANLTVDPEWARL